VSSFLSSHVISYLYLLITFFCCYPRSFLSLIYIRAFYSVSLVRV
jgi:hypothetical protein